MKKIGLFFLLFGLVVGLGAQEFDFVEYFKKKTEQYFPEAVRVRRHLHGCPELCYQERETSAFVADYLKQLGLEVQTGIAGTGIKAILEGNRKRPVLAIRADMDALPIAEKTGLSFASKNEGTMHACGHDAHMTNVLIAARMLAEIKDKIPGTIVFIFQPCEEGPPAGQAGGALAMIRAGVLENPHIDAIVGLHVIPDLPLGTVGIRKGAIMANVASVYIKIFGRAGHGAFPHQGIDAIYASASAIMQFQSLVSRMRNPMEPAVLTIGKIKGGVRLNVIADEVALEGTVRTFSFACQDKLSMGMEKILKGLAVAYGIKYRFDFSKDGPFVKNDDRLTDFFLPLFKRILGEEDVRMIEPLTVAEDFAQYSHKIPALFFLMGVGGQAAIHTPEFAVDEQVFKTAPLLFAAAALHYLKNFTPR